MDSHNPTERGSRFIHLTGKTFGRWSVLSEAKKRIGKVYWTCRCECGTVSEVAGSVLRRGRSRCCTKCRVTTHGKSAFPEYTVWLAMLGRCRRKSSDAYRNYGQRGITVCDEWQSFAAFYRDMGPRPTPKHTIERKDNDLGYSKGNCKWATRKEQLRNTRRTHFLTFNGIAQCVTDWAKQLGMPPRTLHNRINRGWSVERALTTPVRLLVQNHAHSP